MKKFQDIRDLVVGSFVYNNAHLMTNITLSCGHQATGLFIKAENAFDLDMINYINKSNLFHAYMVIKTDKGLLMTTCGVIGLVGYFVSFNDLTNYMTSSGYHDSDKESLINMSIKDYETSLTTKSKQWIKFQNMMYASNHVLNVVDDTKEEDEK